MIQEPRKLQRGLKDISSLFYRSNALPVSSAPSFQDSEYFAEELPLAGLKISRFVIQDLLYPKDSLLYAALLASWLGKWDQLYTLASYDHHPEYPLETMQNFGACIRRVSLSHEKLLKEDGFRKGDLESKNIGTKSHEVLLMDVPAVLSKEVLRNLTRIAMGWIFILHPHSECFFEIYRSLKKMRGMNTVFICGIIFSEEDSANSFLETAFKRFSETVLKYLGIKLTLFGRAQLPKEGRKPYVWFDPNYEKIFKTSPKAAAAFNAERFPPRVIDQEDDPILQCLSRHELEDLTEIGISLNMRYAARPIS